MLTGILGILGALTGMVPGILQFFTVKANNAHSLALEQLRLQAARENIALQVDLANANADVEQQRAIYNYAAAPSGIKWVDALAVFVRPYITLIMFHAWVGLEVMLLLYGIANGVTFQEMAQVLWDADVKSLFAAIIGFWFGDRMTRRGVQAMAATVAVMNPGAAPAAQASKVSVIDKAKEFGARFVPAPAGSRTDIGG